MKFFKIKMMISFILFFALSIWSLPAFAGTPVIFYSDLVNGPKVGGQDNQGAFVTIWGKGFGSVKGTSYITVGGGQVAEYPIWFDSKISFQLGSSAATGNIVVHTADDSSKESIPFTVNTGRIFFATNADNSSGSGTYSDPWGHAVSFYDQVQAGDTLYLRGGTYTGQYGKTFMSASFQIMTGKEGTSDANIAWVAYPGETVVFLWGQGKHFQLRSKTDTSKSAHYNTISQIVMDGNGSSNTGGVEAGGWYLNEEEGAHHIRVVGCRITNAAKGDGTTMTGHVRFTNDGSKLLGTEIDNVGIKGNPFNNNHLIYVQCGADNIEIAYNNFHDSAAGHCIQIHADHAPYRYENIRIHSNKISNDNPRDMRGPTVSNVLSDTTVYYYNNIVSNVGWYSAFNIVYGNVYIYNNTFYNIGGSGVVSLMDDRGQHVYIKNNIMWSDGSVPYVYFGSYGNGRADWDNVTLENNCYYNNGAGPTQDNSPINNNPGITNPGSGNFSLQSDSPCKDKGTSSVVSIVKNDINGKSRPRDSYYDIGAFEYDGTESSPNTPVIAPSNVRIE